MPPKVKDIALPDDDQVAEKVAGPDKVAALASEAAPLVKPDGTPDLIPYQVLRRRQKAVLLRALDAMQANSKTMVDLDVDEQSIDVAGAATITDLMADAEDVILAAALVREDADAWLSIATDADLMALFSWYVSVMQPGEATPSSD